MKPLTYPKLKGELAKQEQFESHFKIIIFKDSFEKNNLMQEQNI